LEEGDDGWDWATSGLIGKVGQCDGSASPSENENQNKKLVGLPRLMWAEMHSG
jgi:hypothetical protein